jgi:hypothetical protein
MHTDTADENSVIISCKKMAFEILLSEPFENASRALLIKIKSPPLAATSSPPKNLICS